MVQIMTPADRCHVVLGQARTPRRFRSRLSSNLANLDIFNFNGIQYIKFEMWGLYLLRFGFIGVRGYTYIDRQGTVPHIQCSKLGTIKLMNKIGVCVTLAQTAYGNKEQKDISLFLWHTLLLKAVVYIGLSWLQSVNHGCIWQEEFLTFWSRCHH